MIKKQFLNTILFKILTIILIYVQTFYSKINEKNIEINNNNNNSSNLLLSCYQQYESKYLNKEFLKRACHHRMKWIEESQLKEFQVNSITSKL